MPPSNINNSSKDSSKGNKIATNQFFLGRSGPLLETVSLDYFALMKEREANAAVEHKSAQVIQKMLRGSGTRIALSVLRAAVIRIQRSLRAFITSRKEYFRLRNEERSARMTLYNRSAILIHKLWRGYYSRKTNPHLTHSVRKTYFDSIKSKVHGSLLDMVYSFIIHHAYY